jgi:hypothetical protein
VTPSATSENNRGVTRLIANLPFYRRFLRPPSTEAPSLPRNYPASSVLRASPPSQSARPFSHELPVDPETTITAGTSRVAYGPLLPACRRPYPGRSDGIYPLVLFLSLRLPRNRGGSAPAAVFSRPAPRLLPLRPARTPSRQCDLLHPRLQQLRCLRRCFDCYRVERTSSRAGSLPLWTTTFHGAPGNGLPGLAQYTRGTDESKSGRRVQLSGCATTLPAIGQHYAPHCRKRAAKYH